MIENANASSIAAVVERFGFDTGSNLTFERLEDDAKADRGMQKPQQGRLKGCSRTDAAVLLFISEVRMAKRRNLKKEKAQRNQAYARKFRKGGNKNSGMFSSRRQRSGAGGRQQNDMVAADED